MTVCVEFLSFCTRMYVFVAISSLLDSLSVIFVLLSIASYATKTFYIVHAALHFYIIIDDNNSSLCLCFQFHLPGGSVTSSLYIYTYFFAIRIEAYLISSNRNFAFQNRHNKIASFIHVKHISFCHCYFSIIYALYCTESHNIANVMHFIVKSTVFTIPRRKAK